MQKLYCYVDETGQDTKGTLFLVALIVSDRTEREQLRALLQTIEKRSGKTGRKWMKTTNQQKESYLTAVLNTKALQGKMLFQQFSQTTQYLTCIVETIARAITKKATSPYKAVIRIDGLGRNERKTVGARLRTSGVRTENVRGTTDEADEFIRLADALAGFVRDALEGQIYAQAYFQKALKQHYLEQL